MTRPFHRSTVLAGATLIVATALGFAACRDNPVAPSQMKMIAPRANVTTDPNAVVLVGAGNIARCDRLVDEATAQLIGSAGAVFTLGDNTYGGALTDYQNCYGPSWGQYLSRTRPAPGEDDYPAAGPAGYFGYFGASAGDPTKGYYSYDLGSSWHIVVLNSSIDMTAGGTQEAWLKGDLAATSRPCILAYWHFPRFTSYQASVRGDVKPLWDDLYAAGADVVLNGHYRFYERFAPQTPAGVADSVKGLRQFTVGTGGMGEDGITGISPLPTSQVIIGGVDGVLQLTLHDWTYDWQFVSLPDQNRSDAGTGLCHGRPGSPPPNQAPTANAGGPYVSERDVTFDASASYDIDKTLPLSYSWTFSDGTTAQGINPVKSFTANGDYTATLVVTDALGLASAPVTASVTINNIPPKPDAGSDAMVQVGSAYTMNGTFTDPGGAADGPWSWTIAWGDGQTSTGVATAVGAPITASHAYAVFGSYTARLTVSEAGGASGSDDALVTVRDPNGAFVLVGAGDIAQCGDTASSLTAKLLDTLPGTVIALGDNAYLSGTYDEFMTCYDPVWGRHKARTKPAVGNHEYATPDAAGYFQYFGAAAGDPSKGYYSYQAGEWLVVVLNSASGSQTRSASSPQVQWLKAQLAGAASAGQCVLAYMHHPQFTSMEGRTDGEWGVIDLWNALYDGGAEVVLDGHDHLYDRFALQKPDGTLDSQYGIRQITVGTGGGEGLNPFGTINPHSERHINSSFGVIKVTLKRGSYDWEWIPVAGGTEHDSGSGTCHGRPDGASTTNQAPVARPGGPYASESNVQFDGSASYDPDNQVPLGYYWNFGDGTAGSGATPTHAYAANGTYTVSLVVTDAFGASSAAATTTVTIANQPPVVNAGADGKAFTGQAFSFLGTFTDPGGSVDAPFTWTIAWGDGQTTTGSTDANGDVVGASHTYASTGTFTVRLTVTDRSGGSGSDDRVVTVALPNRAPTAVAGGPYATQATLILDGSASSDPDGDAITYAWNFGDGTTGTGPKPSKTYTANGTYTVSLVVTDAFGLASAPSTTTVTVANQPPAVNAGLDVLIQAGDTYTASATFTDAGGTDNPWSWTIDWGDGSAVASGSAATSGSTFSASHAYPTAGVYTARVSVTDSKGAVGTDDVIVRVSGNVLLGAGSIARCDKTLDEQTAQVLGRISGTVASIGDLTQNGTASDYTNCYGPSWGQYKSRTRPAPGENEYLASSNYYNYFGSAAAGDPTKGYYSYDIGASWHIVVLNSSISMSSGSAQETWLKADLAANSKQCILAYWHFPRFTAYNGSIRGDVKPLWDDLYAAGADVILNGHGQFYERYAQQTPGEVASTNGIREFIAGTGGQGLTASSSIVPRVNSQVRIVGVYGVLALALDAGSYSWQFVPAAGQPQQTDSGTTTCH